jgi:hypothetical protein
MAYTTDLKSVDYGHVGSSPASGTNFTIVVKPKETTQMKPETIKIDDTTYVRADAKPVGNRAVVVVDRGWIFAGDVTRES